MTGKENPEKQSKNPRFIYIQDEQHWEVCLRK